jgi:hypothetical protein
VVIGASTPQMRATGNRSSATWPCGQHISPSAYLERGRGREIADMPSPKKVVAKDDEAGTEKCRCTTRNLSITRSLSVHTVP